jgi:hypothetical protein
MRNPEEEEEEELGIGGGGDLKRGKEGEILTPRFVPAGGVGKTEVVAAAGSPTNGWDRSKSWRSTLSGITDRVRSGPSLVPPQDRTANTATATPTSFFIYIYFLGPETRMEQCELLYLILMSRLVLCAHNTPSSSVCFRDAKDCPSVGF